MLCLYISLLTREKITNKVYSVIGVGIGIVAIIMVVAMTDHHTVVVLPLDIKMIMTTGLLPILGVWDIQEAFLVISMDCILLVVNH